MGSLLPVGPTCRRSIQSHSISTQSNQIMAKPISINDWIETHQSSFLPPVCNKLLHQQQLKVFFVGGPNQRKDFHLEQGEEFFYMKKGSMQLIILERGQFRSVSIAEGEVFLLPGKILHSPQRQENTIGLVVERERSPNEYDCLRYFVDESTDTLFERWFYCDDLGTQLGPIIREFFASEEHRTGRPIESSIDQTPPYQANDSLTVAAAFNLEQWLLLHQEEILRKGTKKLFDGDCQSDIIVYGRGINQLRAPSGEVSLWQLRGLSTVNLGADGSFTLNADDTLLINEGKSFSLECHEGSFLISICMTTPKLEK